jgi:homopolymeric O-antigen transport system permease protein
LEARVEGAIARLKEESAPIPASQALLAVTDVIAGARTPYVWGLLGWQDIRQRYRRSRIGPFWLTISMGVMVGMLGTLYAGLFKIQVADYLPFITLGFIIWGLISGLIVDGCSAFIQAETIIKQVDLPLSVHVYRLVWRNIIMFFHNIVIFVIVAIVFALWPGWVGLLALPGFVLLCLNGIWVGLLLGLISARFRDVPQIMASVVQVAFFVTPIIWKPELLHNRTWVLSLNPFFHFMELTRTPLLGHAPALISWLVVLGTTLVGWFVTLEAYRRYRWRIAYWI